MSSPLDMNEPKKQSIEIDSAHPTISSGPDSTYDATSKQIAFQHNITLSQEDINSISSILQSTFEAKLELMIRSVMESSVQHIVDGVLVGLSARVAALEHRNNQLSVQNTTLASENDLLRSRLVKLGAASDNQEQYSRRDCIRISGIPETPNNMNTDAVVADLCKDIGVFLDSKDIDRSHRVCREGGSKPRQIIVKFATYRIRQNVYKARSKLKSAGHADVYINEDLTKKRNKLLYEARKLVKASRINSAWSSDGIILIKDRDNKVHRVQRDEDLAGLI